MPTYSYRCDTCHHQFDQIQRFSDNPLTDCPACEGSVRRVIQPVGVVFKGSGWYINDSRKSSDPESKTAKDQEKPKVSETAKNASAEKPATEKTESVKPKTPAPV
ncbi:MAG TPA: FmdB family zinc ribbon protein [Thermomicrobiales bacterium]|nr:FmdB family zinc ribbon protein [Thermomicrobiales bacterium]